MGAVGSCSLLCASVGCDVVIQNAILAAWDSVTRRNFVQSCHENVPRLVRDYEYSFVFRPHAQGSRYLLISTVSTMFAKSVIRSSRILVLTATWVVIDLSESHSGTSAFEWFLIHCFFFSQQRVIMLLDFSKIYIQRKSLRFSNVGQNLIYFWNQSFRYRAL